MACPKCKRSLRVRTSYIGHRIACKSCEYVFKVSAPPEQAVPPPPQEADPGRAARLEEELQRARADLAARTSERDEAGRHLDEARGEIARLQVQVQELQVKIEEIRQGAQELASLQAERARQEEEIGGLRG